MTKDSKRDVIISYNSEDKPTAFRIAEALINRSMRVWCDHLEVPPGYRWLSVLEENLPKVESAIVLIGKDGIGNSQDIEVQALKDEHDKRKIPIIPVFLPGAKKLVKLPILLNCFKWLDFEEFKWLDFGKKIDQHIIDQLVWGITGEKPERVPQFTADVPENDVFKLRLQVSQHSKESIAKYCTCADSEFYWGESLFLQSGSLAAYILCHLYRAYPQIGPKRLITNMLGCSANSIQSKVQALIPGVPFTADYQIETHLIGGKIIDNFAAAMPEELEGNTERYLNAEKNSYGYTTDFLKKRQPDHVVMMATDFKADDGPYSNDSRSRRLKKLLMRYIFENNKKETRLSILFEADKLTLRKHPFAKAADTIDLLDGTEERYWEMLVSERGRVGVFSALSPEMSDEDCSVVKTELRAAKEKGASPVVLLDLNGVPIHLS